MAALFGNSSDGRGEPRSLVEFRAGKMKLTGTTVTADTRKGLVYMKQEDRLMHFYWKDRKNGDVVDDLILFPGEVEFKRVSQCTTGRVYLLKFRDRPDRKYFYWMQEPKDTRDEEFEKKVNDLINNPPDPSQSLAEGLGGGLQSLMGGHGPSLQRLLAGAHGNPQLLEQLISTGALSPLQPGMFEGIGHSSSASSRTSNSTVSRAGRSETGGETPARPSQQPTQSRQLQLGDLQNILSSMNIPSASSEASAVPEEDRVNLNEVVVPDVLRPLSSDPGVQNQVEPHLPPTSEGLDTVLTSPQFQQALGMFGSALQSGQLGPLMTEFGFGGRVASAANTGDVDGFARALQNEFGEGAGGSNEGPAKEAGEKTSEGDGSEDSKEKKNPPSKESTDDKS